MTNRSIILSSTLLWIFLATSCQWVGKKNAPDLIFHTECLSPLPAQARNQGQAESCWAYSMTGLLENKLILCGDSTKLSPWFITRKAYEEATIRAWKHQSNKVSIRGMGHTFINLANRYGIVREKDYPCQSQAQLKKMSQELNNLLKHKEKIKSETELQQQMDIILNRYMGTPPQQVRIDSSLLSPKTYYQKLTKKMSEIKRLTSFQYAPYYQKIVLNYPDNYEKELFLNLPLDSLQNIVEHAIRSGKTAVWEGDISNNGFYWREGLSIWHGSPITVDNREKNYKNGKLHDNHTLLLIGCATDNEGRKYFIAQNSWGTHNRYKGLLYMSLDYFRMWTVAIFL